MDTDRLRRGFGTALGRATQVAIYHKNLTEAAGEIDRLRAEMAKLDELTDRQSKHISDLAAEMGTIRAKDDYILPCDVRLPPGTTIRAGCKLKTLLVALRLRESDDFKTMKEFVERRKT